jgi:hypothetical protein
MTPETIARLDMLVAEVVDFGGGEDVARTVGSILIKRVH